MTFDLDLWPTDLNINRDHLLIKDYLPTKFEASGAKRSWVIRCTRFGRQTWPLTLTFHLLIWISIGIIYLSRTIYLPSLKLLGQSVLELSVAQGKGIPTYRPTYMCNAIRPSFFEGGHKYMSMPGIKPATPCFSTGRLRRLAHQYRCIVALILKILQKNQHAAIQCQIDNG